jgi:RNA polymerase sigma-70 factor (ECF subfamily)
MDDVLDEAGTTSPVAEPKTRTSGAAAADAAFAALVDRHAGLMYRVAYSLLRNPQDAEDAVQETLLKLYRTGAWLQMDDERGFLARSVWCAGLNRLGTQSAKAMRHAEDIAGLELASSSQSPEDAALAGSARGLMNRLIDELPDRFRQTLILSAIEGMRSHEVAEVLGIPEATVRTRVLRAKTELRRRFLQMTAAAEGARR